VGKHKINQKEKKTNGKEGKWECEYRMDLSVASQMKGAYNVKYFYLEVSYCIV
jgi:hypothetical protein